MSDDAVTWDQPVAGYKLLDWLIANGLVERGALVERVVIDVPANGVVKVYVERFGSTKMLNVVPPTLAPSQVHEVARDQSEVRA